MKTGRLLVVDDSASILVVLEDHLSSLGYEVEVASDLVEGLELASKFHPDVILTDLRLQDGTGLDLIREIKAGRPAPGCILLTGYGSMETAIEALRAGADEYLLKPVDLQELDQVVDNLVRHRLATSEVEPLFGGKDNSSAQRLRRLSAPLSLLRAYMEMLTEGRFGPLTDLQQLKVNHARECLQTVTSLVRGSAPAEADSGKQASVAPSDLDHFFHQLFGAWSEDFERRGVHVIWSFPEACPAVWTDLADLRKEAEAFLADGLSRSSMGMTLRSEWQMSENTVTLILRLESAPEQSRLVPAGGMADRPETALPPLVTSVMFRLAHAA